MSIFGVYFIICSCALLLFSECSCFLCSFNYHSHVAVTFLELIENVIERKIISHPDIQNSGNMLWKLEDNQYRLLRRKICTHIIQNIYEKYIERNEFLYSYEPQNKIAQIRNNLWLPLGAWAGLVIPWNFSDSNITNGHFILSSASNQVFYLKGAIFTIGQQTNRKFINCSFFFDIKSYPLKK